MKIAFLTPEFPHPKMHDSGGIGTSIFNLSKTLIHLGHKISIIVYGQKKDETFTDDDIDFYTVKNVKLKGMSLFLTQKKVEHLLNTLINNNKIDIVEAPEWTGFTSFIKVRCAFVIRLHGSDTYFCHLDGRRVKIKNKFLEKRALKTADAVISVSNFTGHLTNQLFGLKKAFTVIPNGVDVNRFIPKNSKKNKQVILYFGTLIRKKGLFELPHIFNLVHQNNKDVELVLVGKDSGDIKTGASSTWQLIKPLFNANVLKKVNYLGKVQYHKIQDLIQSATVCVFPTFAEALPVSWLEAMSMEKAIVASNIGWAKEMIEDEKEGFLVHPTDHYKYAERILELLFDTKKQEQFGKAARKKVQQKFNHEDVAKQSVAFYKKVLKD